MAFLGNPLIGHGLEGVITVLVAWAIHKLSEVHALVNSRSKAQDDKIAALETKISEFLETIHKQDIVIAVSASNPPGEKP